MKRVTLIVLAALVACIAIVAVIFFLFTGAGPIPPATVNFASLSDKEHEALVEKGRYIARAADCEACHVSPQGIAYAGGLPMETPFGTLYGTNITPSKTYGIGNWTADDLYRVMVYGITPSGRRLYPAMPYTSYHSATRGDVDALWVYLMTREPIEKPDPEFDLAFPFNIRAGIAFWNLLYRPDHVIAPDSGKSDTWNRGRYLVDVLGHCGECHTPRNVLFATKKDQALKGDVIEGTEAPDISAEGLVARGWTPKDLHVFLKTGLAPQGTMTFRMFPVLNHSTRYLTDNDLAAMVTYLMGEAPPVPVENDQPISSTDELAAGRGLYVGLCAGCHGSEGEGQPHGSVPLVTNTSLKLANPLNLVLAIRNGFAATDLPGTNRMQTMPAFGDRLTDQQMAELVNYLRITWGGQPGDVTAEQISQILPTSTQQRYTHRISAES